MSRSCFFGNCVTQLVRLPCVSCMSFVPDSYNNLNNLSVETLLLLA